MRRFDFFTASGSVVSCKPINRELIDDYFANDQPPEAPTEEVEVFGGVTETVWLYDDPDYQREVNLYKIRTMLDLYDLFSKSIKIKQISADDAEYERELKAGNNRYDLNLDVIFAVQSDLSDFVDECLYHSTVTIRGLQESFERFNVTYLGNPVNKAVLPGTYAMRAQIFEDWQAAIHGNHTWESFCKLPGPKQCDYVAFFKSDQILRSLLTLEKRNKNNG